MFGAASVSRRHGRSAAAKLTYFAVALVTFATTTATASATTARPAVRPTARRPAVPQLDWADCGDGFDCATATLPLDYDQPQGATIKLKLIRLPASDPSRRIGSVFLNPGGPGGSGVDMVRQVGKLLYSDEVRARFDLVGFDPRGIRRSTPLHCFDSLDEALGVLTPYAFPFTRPEDRAWEHSDRLLADACSTHAGPIIDHMSTANVARDLDLLRQAVGDAQLTYAGYSYGSYIGNTYANLFPGKVRALIVDGVLDPIAWSTGRGNDARTLPFSTRIGSDEGAAVTLQQFFELCDRGGRSCAFSGNAAGRYRNLTRRLLDNPLVLPDGTVISYADVVGFTLNSLYDPPTWPKLAKTLAQVEAALSEPAVAGDDLQTELTAYDNYPNFVEGGPGVACSDTNNPSTPGAWATAAAAADREFGYFGRPWTWLSSVCAVWPGADHDRYMGPFTHRTANPAPCANPMSFPSRGRPPPTRREPQ